MKKLISFFLILATLTTLLVSCNNTSNNNNKKETETNNADDSTLNLYRPFLEYEDDNFEDYITLPNIDGIEIKIIDTTVTQEAIDQRLEENIDTYFLNADIYDDVTGRTAQNGDYILYDMSGIMDNKDLGFDDDYFTYEGAIIYSLGNAAFFPGFQEALVGMAIGETKSVHLTFPENYTGIDDVAGESVTFTFTLKEIKTLNTSKINDEVVKECTEYQTYDEYYNSVVKTLRNEKATEETERQKRDVRQYLLKNTTIIKKNDVLVEQYYNNYVNTYKANAESMGKDFATYLADIDAGTEEYFYNDATEYSEQVALQLMIVTLIGKQRNITLTEDEYDRYLEALRIEYGYSTKENFLQSTTEKVTAENIYMNYVVDYVLNNAKIVE